MFIRIFRWIGIVLGTLIVIAVVLVGVLYARGNARLTKKYDVQVESVVIPTDAASIDRGKKWAAVLCADCHGADFSGKPLLDDKTIGFVASPNLTSGAGGAGSEFTDADWVIAVRHGVDPHGGRAFLAMPSMSYYYVNDQDLGAIIAYIQSVPPVNNEMGEPNMTFMGKVLLGAGIFGKDILPAEVIDHTGPRPSTVAPGVNVNYGGSLVRVTGCRDCHGEDLAGGKSTALGAPNGPDITSSGIGGTWSQETFTAAVRTMKGKEMPWANLKPLDDAELEAIFMYLQSLPGK